MTRYAIFGAGPLGAFALDVEEAHIARSPAIEGVLEALDRDREGEPDVSWPPFGAAPDDLPPDFIRLTVGPGFL